MGLHALVPALVGVWVLGGAAGCTGDALPIADAPGGAGELGAARDMTIGPDFGVGGLFGPPLVINVPADVEAESVAIGDVTGDGRSDVIVGAWPHNLQLNAVILVYRQQADGKLGPAASYLGGDRGDPLAVDVGDLNGDGRLDIAFSRRIDVGVMLQDSAGRLGAAQTLPATQAGDTGQSVVAVADLDGDGRADVTGTGWATDGVDVWLQTADGKLAPPRSFPCPHRGFDDIAVGDLNGDGRTDILLAGVQSYDATYLLQQPGGFAPYQRLRLGDGPVGVAIGDVDGDGRSDLVFTTGDNSPRSKIGVVHQTAMGTLGMTSLFNSYDIPSNVAVADVDGDGRADVIVLHAGWEAIGVYRQRADGGLAPEELYPAPYLDWGPDRLAVGDVNGDGWPDVVAVSGLDVAILYHR
jgi:hypothetical protein